MADILIDIGIIIVVATILGFIARSFKQPLIPAYILAGLIIGPVGLGWVTDIEIIRTLSEIGIAFLLFVVGLEIDFKRLRDVGLVATLGGTIQVVFMFSAGLIVAWLSGIFTVTDAIYIGAMLAFSSTMVVVKILSDKKELDTLHGRIIIGILLMEDILAILAMSLLGSLEQINASIFVMALVKGLALFAITWAASKFVFPAIFKQAARSQEIFFLTSVTVCFVFAYLGVLFGFSIVVGAFLAGIALANLPYNLEIIGRVKPLRDFFATMFFVTLGMGLVFGSVTLMVVPIIILLAVILVFKPILIMFIGGLFGYARRTTFLTGITMAQVSEFGLIIVAQGLVLGHISPELSTLAVLLAIVTITITSYLIKYDTQIYHKINRLLLLFDKLSKKKKEYAYLPEEKQFDVIVVGYDRIGYSVLKTLRRLNKSFIIVDFNPDIIKRMAHDKVPCLYGDIADIEIIERLDLRHAEIIISTVPEKTDNLLLIQKIKDVNHKANIFVTAGVIDDALELYDAGADYVILPHFLGGDHVSFMLEDITTDINKLLSTKIKHIEELHERKHAGHEHIHHNKSYGQSHR